MADGPNVINQHPNVAPYAAYSKWTLVKMRSDGTYEKCAATDQACGVLAADCDPADTDEYKRRVTLLPINGMKVIRAISNGAVTANTDAYGAANGRVDDASGANYIKYGKFLTSATAALQEVDILVIPSFPLGS